MTFNMIRGKIKTFNQNVKPKCWYCHIKPALNLKEKLEFFHRFFQPNCVWFEKLFYFNIIACREKICVKNKFLYWAAYWKKVSKLVLYSKSTHEQMGWWFSGLHFYAFLKDFLVIWSSFSSLHLNFLRLPSKWTPIENAA